MQKEITNDEAVREIEKIATFIVGRIRDRLFTIESSNGLFCVRNDVEPGGIALVRGGVVVYLSKVYEPDHVRMSVNRIYAYSIVDEEMAKSLRNGTWPAMQLVYVGPFARFVDGPWWASIREMPRHIRRIGRTMTGQEDQEVAFEDRWAQTHAPAGEKNTAPVGNRNRREPRGGGRNAKPTVPERKSKRNGGRDE